MWAGGRGSRGGGGRGSLNYLHLGEEEEEAEEAEEADKGRPWFYEGKGGAGSGELFCFFVSLFFLFLLPYL